jgi:RNA recognition motif-containing protein
MFAQSIFRVAASVASDFGRRRDLMDVGTRTSAHIIPCHSRRVISMNLYVGNLAYSVTEADLRDAFGAYGTVSKVSLISDKFTGQSKGFAFVEMPDKADAEAAMSGLNNKSLGGRPMKVNEAKPREDRPPQRNNRY